MKHHLFLQSAAFGLLVVFVGVIYQVIDTVTNHAQRFYRLRSPQ